MLNSVGVRARNIASSLENDRADAACRATGLPLIRAAGREPQHQSFIFVAVCSIPLRICLCNHAFCASSFASSCKARCRAPALLALTTDADADAMLDSICLIAEMISLVESPVGIDGDDVAVAVGSGGVWRVAGMADAMAAGMSQVGGVFAQPFPDASRMTALATGRYVSPRLSASCWRRIFRDAR